MNQTSWGTTPNRWTQGQGNEMPRGAPRAGGTAAKAAATAGAQSQTQARARRPKLWRFKPSRPGRQAPRAQMMVPEAMVWLRSTTTMPLRMK